VKHPWDNKEGNSYDDNTQGSSWPRILKVPQGNQCLTLPLRQELANSTSPQLVSQDYQLGCLHVRFQLDACLNHTGKRMVQAYACLYGPEPVASPADEDINNGCLIMSLNNISKEHISLPGFAPRIRSQDSPGLVAFRGNECHEVACGHQFEKIAQSFQE